jgi:hypothetical protein
MKKFEWCFGFPEPMKHKGVSKMEQFGTYGLKTLSAVHISYFKTFQFQGAKSLIEMMLSFRKHKEAVAMNILKTMLTLAQKIPEFFDFMCDLPTPFYLYGNFHEWIPSFIEYYKEEMQRYCYHLEDYKRVLAVVEKIYPWYVEEFNKRLDLKYGKQQPLKPKPT